MHFQPYLLLGHLLFAFTAQAANIMRKRDMRCPTGSGGAGSYADPTNCYRYYYCVAGNPEPTLHDCQNGTAFSSSLRRCVVTARSSCAQ